MPALPDPDPGQTHLLLASRHACRGLMNALAARLALAGPLRVLDGGNLFDLYAIARAVRRGTPRLEAAMERLRIARAFTCYQVATLLAGQELASTPLLVMDLLATFYDENVPAEERLRLLAGCLAQLQCLGRAAPLVVSATPPPPGAQSAELLARLERSIQHIWRFEGEEDEPLQARLL